MVVLFPLALLVGQLSVLRGRGHLMGLFYFEEHWRGGTVLHGPEFTDRVRTSLDSQHYDIANTIMWVSVSGNLSSKFQSPFLGVGLDRGLLKLRLIVLGLHTNPVWVIPELVLLQAHLCGKRCLTVGTAMTQLLGYGGLIQTQTRGEGI